MRRVRKLMALLRVDIYRRALRHHRIAAAIEHTRVLGPLDVSTVIDVGGNRGQFALFATHVFPGARIISFEPLATPARRFAGLFADQPQVTLFEVALGSSSGTATMHVSGHDDSSSLLPISRRQSELFAGTGAVGTASVTVGTLAEYVDPETMARPALLKLDVQGFELEVLRGCESQLDVFDFVCAEGSFTELYEGQALAPEIIEWLGDRGFALTSVYGPVTDRLGRIVQADMLFTAEPKARSR